MGCEGPGAQRTSASPKEQGRRAGVFLSHGRDGPGHSGHPCSPQTLHTQPHGGSTTRPRTGRALRAPVSGSTRTENKYWAQGCSVQGGAQCRASAQGMGSSGQDGCSVQGVAQGMGELSAGRCSGQGGCSGQGECSVQVRCSVQGGAQGRGQLSAGVCSVQRGCSWQVVLRAGVLRSGVLSADRVLRAVVCSVQGVAQGRECAQGRASTQCKEVLRAGPVLSPFLVLGMVGVQHTERPLPPCLLPACLSITVGPGGSHQDRCDLPPASTFGKEGPSLPPQPSGQAGT